MKVYVDNVGEIEVVPGDGAWRRAKAPDDKNGKSSISYKGYDNCIYIKDWKNGTTNIINLAENNRSDTVPGIVQTPPATTPLLIELRRRELEKSFISLSPAKDTHPYIIKKKIKPHNCKQNYTNLVIPLEYIQDDKFNTEIASLQYINEKGDKFFAKGGRTKNTCHIIGRKTFDNTIILCEGFATGEALKMIFDYMGQENITILCSMSACNLYSLSIHINKILGREKSKTVLVFADNDAENDINIGLKKAKSASFILRCPLIVPEYKAKTVDFNDLFIYRGLQYCCDLIKTKL